MMKEWVTRAYRRMPDRLRHALYPQVEAIAAGVGAGLKLDTRRARHSDYLAGTNEQPLQQALAHLLGAGDVLYDIGANIGFFTLIGARLVERKGHVYAFEPVPANVRAIRRNVALNDFENVTVFEKAAASSGGAGALNLTVHPGGAALVSGAVTPPDTIKTISVDLVSIDQWIDAQQLRPPTVVKIDVEGAELGVLRGMEETLMTHRPVLIYEVDDGDPAAFQRRFQALDDFVQACGYAVEHLPEAYPSAGWQVGHAVARPVG